MLHHDKVGSADRLRLSRIAGPGGKTVWDATLSLANLQVVAGGKRTLILIGTEPNPAHDPRAKTSREDHEKIVALDIASGGLSTFDLTAESAREEEPSGTMGAMP